MRHIKVDVFLRRADVTAINLLFIYAYTKRVVLSYIIPCYIWNELCSC